MVKFKLGYTDEELREEQAELQKKLDEEAAQLELSQLTKLRQNQKKRRLVRIGLLIFIGVFTIALISFGAYGAFFKKSMTQDEVTRIALAYSTRFDSTGLEGFIHDNFNTWYESSSSLKNPKLEYCKPKLETLYINSVQEFNSTLARVYFSLDLESKTLEEKDAKGAITKSSEVTTKRYSFVMPIERYHNSLPDGTPTVWGYRPTGNLSIYTLKRIDSPNKVNNPNLAFKGEALGEEDKKSAQIKVDKTLNDLYSGRDVSQDFINFLEFNSYDAEYVQLDSFDIYSEANGLGYNAFAKYTIRTSEGLTFTNQIYINMKPSGNSWVIYGIL